MLHGCLGAGALVMMADGSLRFTGQGTVTADGLRQARELGTYWVNGWGPDAGERLLQRLMAVTPAQVQSVAQRLFDERQLNVGVLVPEAKP